MRLLVDTHAYLWWGIEPSKLSARAAHALSNSENEVYVSVASLWEIMVKTKLGKLELPVPLQLYATRQREENLVQTLPITEAHVYAHAALRDLHKDPFDRMLVAQALAEGLTLVTRDARIQEYGLPTFW